MEVVYLTILLVAGVTFSAGFIVGALLAMGWYYWLLRKS